jgi:hypothetical protein
MKEKLFKFEDESSLRIIIEDGGAMTIVLQARHLGNRTKITSSSIKLVSEEVVELVNWIGEKLMEEFSKNE